MNKQPKPNENKADNYLASEGFKLAVKHATDPPPSSPLEEKIEKMFKLAQWHSLQCNYLYGSENLCNCRIREIEQFISEVIAECRAEEKFCSHQLDIDMLEKYLNRKQKATLNDEVGVAKWNLIEEIKEFMGFKTSLSNKT